MTAICEYPDGVILKTCEPVDAEFGEGLTNLIGDMKEACLSFRGQGLAANQIGVLKRVIIYQDSQGQMQSLTNPEIIEFGSETSAGQDHSSNGDHRHRADRRLSTDHYGRRGPGSTSHSA